MVKNIPDNPIPFFVVDRPISLEILKYSGINRKQFPLGLMGNANSTPNFQNEFRNFRGKNIIKIVDSGVFTKNGGLSKGYDDLFEKYERMSTDYGIILDVIKNKDKTIKSAKKALKEYKKKKHSFKLVGVAQGKNVKEYLSCYKTLKKMGYKKIAIGGLLKKRLGTARFVVVKNESFLEEVVSKIREEFPRDWLFLLGSFRPKRYMLLKKYKIFGADFKGWVFNYDNPAEKAARFSKNLHDIEKSQNIKNQSITKLTKFYHPHFINFETENDKEKLLKVIKIRKKLKRKIRSIEYKNNLKKLEKLLNTNPKKFQKFRFDEIKKFLHKQVFSPMHSKKLLIISCSERKKNLKSLTPAIELYDGPMYRMIRNFKPIYYNGIDLMIVSAKYGLIQYNHPIRNYEKRLKKNYIPRLSEKTKIRLEKKLRTANYDEIMLSMGKDYLQLFDGIEEIAPQCKISIAKGKIGQKLHHTKVWLEKSN